MVSFLEKFRLGSWREVATKYVLCSASQTVTMAVLVLQEVQAGLVVRFGKESTMN